MTNPLTGFGDNAGAGGSSTLPEFNWATKPAAADYSGRLIRIADVGINGSLWFSDGTRWIHESPIILQQAAKGWLVPSLAAANAATYSQAGTTLTVTSVGHNIPATAHDGKDVYLAIASGDAVAGWYSNFTRTGVDTFTCESSVSQSTSGAINTNLAETTITELSFAVHGGLTGDNGSIQGTIHNTHFQGSGFRRSRWKFDGSTVLDSVANTTSIEASFTKLVCNRNSQNKQVWRNAAIGNYQGLIQNTSPTGYSLIDTSQDVQSLITLQNVAANEFIALESFLLEVRPS